MQGLTAVKRQEAYQRSKGHCHVCGDFVKFEDCQIDHIWPLELGGDNEVENLLPAHPVCNHLKWHNDPPTIQRMLFLGMLVNNHGYIDLTPFGGTVRAQRAERLRKNWLRRKLEQHKKSATTVDPDEVEKLKSKATRLHEDFVAFEAEVLEGVQKRRRSRKERVSQVAARDSGDRIGPARDSHRHDWQEVLDMMVIDPRIPQRFRHAYREFAQMEHRSTPDGLP